MNLRLEEFQPEHFFLVDGREGKASEDHRAISMFYYTHGFFIDGSGNLRRSAFTCFDGDEVRGCAGVIMLAERGEVWMHISHELANHPVWITRTAARELRRMIENSRRLFFECFIPIANTVNRYWLTRMLGFRDVGELEIRGEICRHYIREGLCLGWQQQHQQQPLGPVLRQAQAR